MHLSNEAVAALARTIGIDAAEIERRKVFLGFDETDVRLLTDLRARWPKAERFVDNFYERLVSIDEVHDFIPDAASLERLKRAQAAYFDTLTAGDYGDDYVISRLRVGTTHRRIGLDPKWYLGAYSQYLIGLLPELWELFGDDPPRFIATCSALQKIVFLDMGLAFDTYVQADRRAILGLRRYAGDIIASLPNGLAVADADLAVLTANNAFCTMFGLPSGAEVEGRSLGTIVPLEGISDRATAILDGRATSFSMDGAFGEKWLRVTVTGIRLAEEEEEEERLLVIAEDVTEQQTHAVRVEQLAFHDSLTGLPNRALFMDRLQEALLAAERHGESFVVLYMDLDRFKEINDTQGHIVGNQVLVEIARRFRGALRVDEMVARHGR
ncbi:MAG: protoglobin domain-containing protein [Rhodospirillales bacterium]